MHNLMNYLPIDEPKMWGDPVRAAYKIADGVASSLLPKLNFFWFKSRMTLSLFRSPRLCPWGWMSQNNSYFHST